MNYGTIRIDTKVFNEKRRTIMSLMQQIPKDFYRVFRTKNREHYIAILLELYKANMEEYHIFGLTKNECRDIINETMAEQRMVWQEDEEEAEAELEAEEDFETSIEQIEIRTPSNRSLTNLLNWGWLRSDYDEQINEDVITFPEYSLMFVELFWQLNLDSNSQERESIMSIYSLLYTYHTDKDHNNEILKNAWKASRRLTQLLNNMQDGMRSYFDRLSKQKNFLGIQEVLVQEINNSDSKKYAMLTTTDSFYRYKEQVKELISDILNENEEKKFLLEQGKQKEPESLQAHRMERKIAICEETSEYMIRIEREFDNIEQKYNLLIEQKSIFAQRALARVHYIMQEGMSDNNNVLTLINMINKRQDGDCILEELRDKMQFSSSFTQFTEKSLYQKRGSSEKEFAPNAVEVEKKEKESITEFVPKPLYSGKELIDFRRKNTIDGMFMVTKESVKSTEDLEKLMLLWQQITKDTEQGEDKIMLGKKISNEQGMTYTQLIIKEDN